MSTPARSRQQYINELVLVIGAVQAAGAEAFAPVAGPDGFVVSTLLIRAIAALTGAPVDVGARARAALKAVVGGGVARLDCTEQTLRDEVLELNREARRRSRLAA